MKFLILIFLPFVSFGQSKLDTVSIRNGRVKFLSPVELSNMTDEMWAFKYQKRARPELVLTDENGEVNLIASLTQQPVTDTQIEGFKEFQMAQLKKSRPDIILLSEGVKNINGKKVGYFKFISQAIDQKVFNYFFFTSLDGKILLFTFNCIEKKKSNWENTADNIVASLQIN